MPTVGICPHCGVKNRWLVNHERVGVASTRSDARLLDSENICVKANPTLSTFVNAE